MSAGPERDRDRHPARSTQSPAVVIDPPVTPDERLADAIAAFGLLCDRVVEYLELLRWTAPSGDSFDPSR